MEPSHFFVYSGVILAAAINLYFICSAFRLSVSSAKTVSQMVAANSRASASTPVPRVKFVVVIPAIREGAVMADALGHFAGVTAEDEDITILVVTTEREAIERDSAIAKMQRNFSEGLSNIKFNANELEILLSPEDRQKLSNRSFNDAELLNHVKSQLRSLTLDVAKAEAKKLNEQIGRQLIDVVVAPAVFERKVGQLNYAYQLIKNKDPSCDVYMTIYDADSRPDPQVFRVMRSELASRFIMGKYPPAILQQVSCYCKNIGGLSSFAGYLRIADAIAQTRWALGFEYPMYRRYNRAVFTGGIRQLVYCVGHGCSVSLSFLNRTSGFPTESPTDDLALGYLAAMMGEQVVPIPSLDFCDIAPNPFATVRQSGFWYLGSAQFASDMRNFRDNRNISVPLKHRIVFFLDGHLRKIAWAWRGAWFLAALSISLLLASPALLGFTIAAHLLYVQAGFFQTISQLNSMPQSLAATSIGKMSAGTAVLSALLGSVVFLIRSLGPLTASVGLYSFSSSWKTDR
jgi:hypothetical protein